MKSGGPWNLRGLRPEARAAAREAARRSGMSVGEWLNTVIQPVDDDEEESWWGAAAEPEADSARRRPSRRDDWEPERERVWEPEREHVWEPERQRVRERDQRRSPPRRREQAEDRWQESARYRDWERYRPREADRRRRDRMADDQYLAPSGDEDWARDRRGHFRPPERERFDESNHERPVRREDRPDRGAESRRGSPYRTEDERGDPSAPRVPVREPEVAASPQGDRDASIDRAIAEIEARQRVLDGSVGAERKAQQRAGNAAAAAEAAAPAVDAAATPPERSFGEREPQPLPPRPEQDPAPPAGPPPLDLSGLEQQLREITTKIESLRSNADLDNAIGALHAELATISRSLTEALPRRALESLEIEIKALAARIDHSRQNGVDAGALAGIERGLTEVREALSKLTPAEGLVGVGEAVNALAGKVDAIVAKDDPTTLQQLETAISALRGIVSHVASNDTLAKVAEDVRSLAAKVDGLAATAPALSSLELRIDKLAGAITASTEAGHAVPRELEKLLSGLIEKLEWVQLTHTDHSALAHLEDRIAALVKRLDVSDARLGILEGVERGLSDLLVYIEQLRNGRGAGVVGAVAAQPPAAEPIEQQVAAIQEAERRTQDSLEDVHGTVERVVDRLAMIESDMRGDKAKRDEPFPPSPPRAEAAQTQAPESLAGPADDSPDPSPNPPAPAEADAAPKPRPEVVPPRPAVARKPIDPTLPPDHPLEPGLAGRARHQLSAADRIAASEAVVGAKPPVIPDPGGGKPDFIAAARRAARAAATTTPATRPAAAASSVQAPTPARKLSGRLRAVAVAVAVVLIIVGGFRILSRIFVDNGGTNPPQQTHNEAPRGLKEPLQLQPEPEQTPPPSPGPQTAPPAPSGEPPHAQAEPAPAPAAAPPSKTQPESGAAPGPAASPPGDGSGVPQQGAAPGQQSLFDGDRAEREAKAPAPAAKPTEITGSLPDLMVQRAPASPAPPTSADRLPVAIGTPALRAAALAGDPSAAYEVAMRFADGGVVPANNQEAARWFEIAARKGLAPAQFRLGMMYEKGLGVTKSLAIARDLYRAAAEKGHGKAMHNLAVLYAEGTDGKPDYAAAAQWFRKAADRGVADSQYNLAVLYARGIGVDQSFADAYKWFFLAAKDGDQDAAQKRDQVATHLDPKTLAAMRRAAESWAPVPQPADAVSVKGAWDGPANGATPKPKARSAKAPQSILPTTVN